MKHFKENEKSHLSARDLIKKKILDKIDDYQPDIVGASIVFSVAHYNNTLVVNTIK